MSKRKPSILYSRRVQHDGVDHEFFHHAMLAGGIRAAATRFEIAVCVEPVIIVGHNFVEH